VKGGKYWNVGANFMLAENDVTSIDPRLGPGGVTGPAIRIRVDKNPVDDYYYIGGLIERVTARGALGLLISNVEGSKECVSDFVYQLAHGSEMVVEFHTLGGGVRYAEFKLSNGEQVISQAIRKDLSDRANQDYCLGIKLARKACIGKGSNCSIKLQQCADKTDTAEKFNACALPITRGSK
jgi:hypothetical protein